MSDRRPEIGIARLLGLARPEARLLSVATVALFVGSALSLAAPQGIRLMLDAVQAPDGRARLASALVRLLAVFAFLGVAGFVRAYLFTLAGERVVARLRRRLFGHILSQEVGFFDVQRTGDLLSLIASDTALLQNSVTVNVSMALRFGLQAVGSLVVLSVTSPRLTLVMLSVVPVVTIGAIVFVRAVRALSQRAQEALGRASNVAEESIAGVRTVRSFAREDAETARYGAAIDEVFAVGRRLAVAYGLFQGAAGFAAYAALGLVLWYGGTLVLGGAMTVGELGAFLLYTLFLAFGLGGLSGLQGDYARALGAAARIFELLDREPALANRGGAQLPPGDLTVVLEHVEFRYPSRPEQTVLRDVGLTLQPGRVVALVGPSGSGKSSVAALLARFYDPSGGRVTIQGDDGVRDLRELDPTSWREAVSLVAQEPMLFATSIEENVRYGRPLATHDEVLGALRAANALDFVLALPEGLATMVGERGVRLSGGQRQRLAIARALLKDPRVLVLDEATSALDAESEHLVQEALERLIRGRTVLIIAHRLSTVKDADRVVVLDRGRVVEQGTHAELVELGGMYRRLVELQLVRELD